MFSNRVLLDSRWTLVVWTTWPLKRYWGGLTLFSFALIAHAAIRTGMHRRASVIDRSWSFPTAVLRNTFALGWFCAEHLISVWKVCNSNESLLSHTQSCFTNALNKWDIAGIIWKRSWLLYIFLTTSLFSKVAFLSHWFNVFSTCSSFPSTVQGFVDDIFYKPRETNMKQCTRSDGTIPLVCGVVFFPSRSESSGFRTYN